MFKTTKSMFLSILLNENNCLKAELKPDSFKLIVPCMQALRLNSNFLISSLTGNSNKYFPAVLTTQIDQSSLDSYLVNVTVQINLVVVDNSVLEKSLELP